MPSIGKSATKSAKKIAQSAAKQILDEPFEILKKSGEQTVGVKREPQERRTEEKTVDMEEKREADNAKSRRLIQALENELKDVEKQKQEEEQNKKITEEQKKQEETGLETNNLPLVEPSSKQKRGGIRGFINRVKKRTETRLPPSG